MGQVGEDLQYQEFRDKVVAVAGHKAKVRVLYLEKKAAYSRWRIGVGGYRTLRR